MRMKDFDPLQHYRWNVGLIGAGGTGKTTMAATAPGTKFVLDFDDKIAPYAGTDTIVCQLMDRDFDNPRAWQTAKRVLDMGLREGGALYVDKNGGVLDENGWPLEDGERIPFDWWILDSFTNYEQRCMAQGLVDDSRKMSPADGPAEHHYAYAMQRSGQLVDRFRALPVNRIVIFHWDIIEIRSRGTLVDTVHQPLVIGKTRFRVANWFGEFYHLFTEQEDGETVHRMYTHRSDHITAVTTVGKDIFDPVEIPDFTTLMDKIRRHKR